MTTAAPAKFLRFPKPAGVPSGCPKTTHRDFSGMQHCIECGRTTTRAFCRDLVNGRWTDIGHVDPTGECCVGMLVVRATWAARGFEAVLWDNGDGTAECEWAVCPDHVEEFEEHP